MRSYEYSTILLTAFSTAFTSPSEKYASIVTTHPYPPHTPTFPSLIFVLLFASILNTNLLKKSQKTIHYTMSREV